MSVVIENLNRIINSRYRCEKEKNKYCLKEFKNDMQPTYMTCSNSIEILACKFDERKKEEQSKGELFPYFNQEITGLCKMSDYIVFAHCKHKKREGLYIFSIELKKSDSNYRKQLEAGECFAEYLVNSAKRVCREDLKCKWVKSNIVKYIFICGRKITKKTIKFPKRIAKKNTKEHTLSAGVSFNIERYCS